MNKLKKANAALALLSVPLLLVHIGFSVYTYLAFTYDPVMKALTSVPAIAVICLHAICGMVAVFTLSDGTRMNLYPGQNRRTVLQRVSAAVILPLLLLHLNTFGNLKSAAEAGNWVAFALVIACQLLFYATVLLHTSLSVSRALVTLGWLSSPEKRRTLDRAALVCGAVVFAVAAFAVVKGEIDMIPMFLQEGAAP